MTTAVRTGTASTEAILRRFAYGEVRPDMTSRSSLTSAPRPARQQPHQLAAKLVDDVGDGLGGRPSGGRCSVDSAPIRTYVVNETVSFT